MTLYFSMLDRLVIQEGIQLHSFIRSCTILILFIERKIYRKYYKTVPFLSFLKKKVLCGILFQIICNPQDIRTNILKVRT